MGFSKFRFEHSLEGIVELARALVANGKGSRNRVGRLTDDLQRFSRSHHWSADQLLRVELCALDMMSTAESNRMLARLLSG